MIRPLRIGSVAYLNARPLVQGLQEACPEAEIRYEVPSRLADLLASGELDVALAPCIELARRPDWVMISNACIGCRGPVLSVKLRFRTPPDKVATLAVDEGSRTSVVLAQILLADIAGVRPVVTPLPLTDDPDSVDADAVLVIGDRAMGTDRSDLVDVWDLGDRWTRWTELPMAFAAWMIRDPNASAGRMDGVRGPSAEQLLSLEQSLNASRDAGVASLGSIAASAAESMHIPYQATLKYLRDNLNYYFDAGERRGLELYFRRATRLGLIPSTPSLRFYASPVRC